MANLLSPGVSVTVVDDSISSASGNGTVPLFVIATAQDKLVAGSSTVAAGTTKANAGKLQIITSQRNCLETFGSPVFQIHDGSVVQGDELNEYGAHAVYSYMGIANRAYVVRADLDLAQLAPSGEEPTGPVPNGTLWLDTRSTQVEAYVLKAGLSEATSFYDWVRKPVTIVSAENIQDVSTTSLNAGDLVIRHIPSTGQMLVYVFTAAGLAQQKTILSPINKVPVGKDPADNEAFSIWIRDGYTKNGSQYFGTRFVMKRYASLTGVWVEVPVYTGNSFYEIEAKAGVFNNTYFGSLFDEDSYSFSLYTKSASLASMAAPVVSLGQGGMAAPADGFLTFKFLNKTVTVKSIEAGKAFGSAQVVANLHKSVDLLNAGFKFVEASGRIEMQNINGYSFKTSQSGESTFSAMDLAKLQVESSNYSLINVRNLRVSPVAPVSIAPNGTYWYNFNNSDSLTVTLYVADVVNDKWVKVLDANKYIQLDEPAADRDFWVQPLSQGIEGYKFYRVVDGAWQLLDDTDQSTLNGLVFEDFTSGDVPAAELYQNSMLAVDLGTTEGVVKIMKNGKWTVASGTALNGAGVFGRHAQRKVIVEALAAVVIGNEAIRAEDIDFNLMCVPGYVELLDELVTLNVDRKETAFIVTDVPARLTPTATAIQAWATNQNNAPSNGDVGRTTAYDYAAQYEGWCLSTNVDGREVAVPGSTIAMRTYAYSDSVSYVWYPPAGTTRGVVTNASSVGYINAEGEYAPVIYSQGQRDAMYVNKINPITMRPSRGLLVFGDKTLSPNPTSALSSVNVARLVVYIRRQLEILADPFLFRLNTPGVRQEFTSVVNNFLAEIVQLNGLYDFLVVCDESNNTTARINRSELWMDIAIVPVRSINFIYIPMRIQTTINNNQ